MERKGILTMLKGSDIQEIGIRVDFFNNIFLDKGTKQGLEEYKVLIGMPFKKLKNSDFQI